MTGNPRTWIEQRKGMWIGNEWSKTGSAGELPKLNPATGELLAPVPLGGPKEVEAAVAAAAEAFPVWRDTPPTTRRDILLRLAALVDEHVEAFGALSALELGLPTSQAAQLVGLTTEWIRYYAGWCDKIEGRAQSTAPAPGLGWAKPEPYGVVGVILTWNFPLASAAMKTIPALAAGNCVVTKLAELSPFGTMLFAELLEQAGLPPGVASFVCGTGEAGAHLTQHPSVAKISFTGGIRTAHAVAKDASGQLKPLVLELGGKSANLLFADANLDTAVPFSVAMALLGAGQGCALPTRLLVERSIYDEVLERAVLVATGLPQGDPFEPTTLVGPVIHEAALERILGVIEGAARSGAGRLVAGGGRAGGTLANGFFIEPTVFADVDNASSLAQEEIFGPVLSILPFEDEADAISKANHNSYGLAAFLQTKDLDRALRVADRIEAGYVSVNGWSGLAPSLPFGGFRASGYGKEGGRDGLAEFLRVKSVFFTRG